MSAEAARDRIVLRGISKSYATHGRGATGQKLVLDGIDLTIGEGEFLTIIGPSGCGKTTLLRIMASLIPADSGEVFVNGRVVTAPSIERAMVFQSFGLFPWKTVLDNVKFPLTINGVSDREATERAMVFLDKVGLADSTQAHPHQLSGGMQQRVGLARALATDPDVLLMDEPFGAIDAQTRELMQAELLSIWQRTSSTVIMVTHQLDEAVFLADKVLVMGRNPGRLLRSIEVPFARPRSLAIKHEPDFHAITDEIWSLIEGAVMEALGRTDPDTGAELLPRDLGQHGNSA